MDLNSAQGFSTKVWGPLLWTFLHMVSFNYPCEPSPEVQRKYYNFMRSLGDVLPCGVCRRNYPHNLEQLRFGMHCMRSRATFSAFIHDLHMLVSEGRFQTPPNEVRRNFELFRATCTGEEGCTNRRCAIVQTVIPPEDVTSSFILSEKCVPKQK